MPGNIPATNGLVIAGNNANGTPGVSNTTLTGRQWGIAPRLGAAWQPEYFHSKVVVRTGFGMYYDRGELFSYFSPGYAIGTVTGGPFGVNQSLPFVNTTECPAGSASLYDGYIPACGGDGFSAGYPYTPVSSPTRCGGEPGTSVWHGGADPAQQSQVLRLEQLSAQPGGDLGGGTAGVAGRVRPRQQAAVHL